MFKNNNIGRFLCGQTISLFGSSLVQYAIVWYITLSTSSGKLVTIGTICGFLPQILISLFAGSFIDRMNRKKIIIIADAVIAVTTLALALYFLLGRGHIIFLFIVLIVRSAGTGIQTPCVQAVIPQMVPAEQLMKINGIQSTLSSVMMFLSPVAGGAILSVSNLEVALLVDVITAVIGIAITATVEVEHEKSSKKASEKEVKIFMEGIAVIKQYPSVKKLLCYQIAILLLISPSAFLTPLMVSRSFGGEVWRLTGSQMTYSLGMIFGGIIITWWGGFKQRLNLTLLAGAVYGILMIGMGYAPVYFIYLICNTMIGVTTPCYNAPITVYIQENCEASVHGRIFSLMQIATSCALPLGMVVFGPLSDYIKIQWIFIGSGSAVVLISCLFFVKDILEIKKSN